MKRALSVMFAATTISTALGLGACAGIPPSTEEMARLPVVDYGTPAPAPAAGGFILHYPAGAPLPVTASVSGSLLEKPAESTLTVAVNRDVYLYRQWVSFDGKTWQAGNDAARGEFLIVLPGEADGKAPGSLSARFDLKP